MTILSIGILLLHIVVSPIAAVHALLYKRDPRAALGWISVCLLFPVFGPFWYFLFGINRVRTRASSLRGARRNSSFIGFERAELPETQPSCTESCKHLQSDMQAFGHLSDTITGHALLPGNDVRLLLNGEGAYPPMLAAIRSSRYSVYLMTYIFEGDCVGLEFIEALSDAVRRGVDVRVILDGLGDYYHYPKASHEFKQHGIPVRLFLSPSFWPPSLYINLRNHRKLLLVDSEIAYAGGMNIGDRHVLQGKSVDKATQDIHFEFIGPLLRQMHDVFATTWRFVANESMPDYSGVPQTSGNAICRTIVDGPDEHLDQLEQIMIGAIVSAKETINIMTPYFLPSREMKAALRTAALKGVEVNVILPEHSNLKFVQWATNNMLGELILYGIRIYSQPLPFSHSKLMIIDQIYCLVGSANIDPRSLRLNFELGIEIFSEECVAELLQYFMSVRDTSRLNQLAELDGRSLPLRMRDAACWLFSPYL